MLLPALLALAPPAFVQNALRTNHSNIQETLATVDVGCMACVRRSLTVILSLLQVEGDTRVCAAVEPTVYCVQGVVLSLHDSNDDVIVHIENVNTDDVLVWCHTLHDSLHDIMVCCRPCKCMLADY